MKGIEFRYSEIPQSVNNLYFTRGRKRILSTEAREFKTRFVASRGGLTAAQLMQLQLDPDAAYSLELWFFLPHDALFNKTFGQRKGVARFKKMDVSNLVKLVEDAISDLLGIPDQNNFTVTAHKRAADDDETGFIARLQPINLEDDPHAVD
jgi:hypothetical protein